MTRSIAEVPTEQGIAAADVNVRRLRRSLAQPGTTALKAETAMADEYATDLLAGSSPPVPAPAASAARGVAPPSGVPVSTDPARAGEAAAHRSVQRRLTTAAAVRRHPAPGRSQERLEVAAQTSHRTMATGPNRTVGAAGSADRHRSVGWVTAPAATATSLALAPQGPGRPVVSRLGDPDPVAVPSVGTAFDVVHRSLVGTGPVITDHPVSSAITTRPVAPAAIPAPSSDTTAPIHRRLPSPTIHRAVTSTASTPGSTASRSLPRRHRTPETSGPVADRHRVERSVAERAVQGGVDRPGRASAPAIAPPRSMVHRSFEDPSAGPGATIDAPAVRRRHRPLATSETTRAGVGATASPSARVTDTSSDVSHRTIEPAPPGRHEPGLHAVASSAALAAAPTVRRRTQPPPVRPAAVPVEAGAGTTGKASPSGRTAKALAQLAAADTQRQVVQRTKSGSAASGSRTSSRKPMSIGTHRTATTDNVPAVTSTASQNGGSASSGSDTGSMSTSARLDMLDDLVAALEERILDQLDRRGGRNLGDW